MLSPLDPIVEHGIQQVTHLDNDCDSLTAWLCGTEPTGEFVPDPEAYGGARVRRSRGRMRESRV